MKQGEGLLLFGIGVFLFVLALSIVPISLPWTGPPHVGGSKPPVTVMTKVTVSNSLNPFAPPSIKSVINEELGYKASAVTPTGPAFDIQWFSFGGRIVVKVVPPSGGIVTIADQKLTLGWGEERTLTFMWTTSQRGKHLVIVELFDDQGHLVDKKVSEVVVV